MFIFKLIFMKNLLKTIYLSIFLTLLLSCSNDNNEDNGDLLTKVVDVEFKMNSNSKTITPTIVNSQIEFTMSEENEAMIDFKFSENILKKLTISEEEFYQKINDRITLNFDGSKKNKFKSNSIASDLSECKKQCHKDYTNEDGTKIKGRGWCKAGCYLDEVIRVAVILVPVLVK